MADAGLDPPHLSETDALADADWAMMDRAPAIIFGAPTYMGSAAASFKAFMDGSTGRWDDRLWKDKVAAGFTVASYHAGDKLSTLQQLAVFAAQHAMIWVGQEAIGPAPGTAGEGPNRDGSYLGLSATASRDKAALIDAGDLGTARRFGARIGLAIRRWHG